MASDGLPLPFVPPNSWGLVGLLHVDGVYLFPYFPYGPSPNPEDYLNVTHRVGDMAPFFALDLGTSGSVYVLNTSDTTNAPVRSLTSRLLPRSDTGFVNLARVRRSNRLAAREIVPGESPSVFIVIGASGEMEWEQVSGDLSATLIRGPRPRPDPLLSLPTRLAAESVLCALYAFCDTHGLLGNELGRGPHLYNAFRAELLRVHDLAGVVAWERAPRPLVLNAPPLELPPPAPGTEFVPAAVSASVNAFRADLPHLLEKHRGRWVAYADGKRLGFGRTQAGLFRHCLEKRRLTDDQFIVRLVVPEADSVDCPPR